MDGDLVVAAVRRAVLGVAVLEIRHAEASAALIRVGGRGVIVEGAEGLVRAVLLEVSALQVGEVLRGLGGRRAGHGTVVRRLVRLSVPVVRQALRVDLLPRRGKARGRHRALHHRREIKRSGGNRSGAGSRSTRSTGARERARKVREGRFRLARNGSSVSSRCVSGLNVRLARTRLDGARHRRRMIGHQALRRMFAGVPATEKADWLTGLDVPHVPQNSRTVRRSRIQSSSR